MSRTVLSASHPDLITSPEAARLLGLNEKSLQRFAREGRGPVRRRIGGRAYYSRAQIDAWLSKKFESNAA
jgi:predicted DNA-binding transcriptional regulator AlpA